MGFSLQRAIRAMQLKGGDIEAAVEYLLMEGDVDEPEPEPEPAPTPEPEKPPVAEEEPVVQIAEGELPDNAYKTTASSNYVLADSCRFPEFTVDEAEANQLSAEWETSVLPFLKQFMEQR